MHLIFSDSLSGIAQLRQSAKNAVEFHVLLATLVAGPAAVDCMMGF